MKKIKKRSVSGFVRDENGAVMVIAAFALVAFLSVASLVTDLGLRYYQKSRLQSALDSAALASVKELPDQVKARNTALDYMQKNGFSTENVQVEFPVEGVVRVKDSTVCRTLFANVFDEEQMNIDAHAAAKYLDKNMSIDFDYLMFYGEDSTFHLSGDFREVAGSVFGNGDVLVECNDAAVIYDIASARDIRFANNMSTQPNVHPHASHQSMPDWDEVIMSVAPEAEKTQFTSLPSHPTKGQTYRYRLSGDSYLNSGSLLFADGGLLCTGSLSTNYSNGNTLFVYGNLYVEGNFTPQCNVYVSGSVYVGGNFNTTWGMSLYVAKSLYVGGNVDLQGPSVVSGSFFSGGNVKITNGNGTTYSFSSLRCLGDFTSMAAWNARITVNGPTFVYGTMNLGGGVNKLNDSVYVWGGTGSKRDDESVCYINGNLTLKGDVWCKKGKLSFGGNGDCEIHGIVYSGGSIATLSGGDISLNGCMVAEGNINIGGASHTYNDAGATLSLYSRNGDIVLGSQGTELKMWGIVYAPKGDIRVSTDGLRVFGSLVANTITCDIGCGFYIGKNDRTLPFAKVIKVAALIE